MAYRTRRRMSQVVVPPPSPPDAIDERWRTTDDGRSYWYVVRPPKDRPCARCPWLKENHGTDDPQYLPSARADLWFIGEGQGGPSLSSGAWQACHVRKDEKPPQRAYLGSEARPHSLTVHGCSGQRVLAERELLRFIEHGASALTHEGAWAYAERLLRREDLTWAEFDRLTIPDILPFTHPSLLDGRIGFEPVEPVSARERQAWAVSQ